MSDYQYLGNKELLQQPKTAFLAATTIPPDRVLQCYDWAQQMCLENQCVISGFSSHLEKKVLHFLLKGGQPIIIVLAGRLYRHIPTELQTPLNDGRLLIISTSSSVRQSKATAAARNRYVCETADSVVMVGVTGQSGLYPLLQQYKMKLLPVGGIKSTAE